MLCACVCALQRVRRTVTSATRQERGFVTPDSAFRLTPSPRTSPARVSQFSIRWEQGHLRPFRTTLIFFKETGGEQLLRLLEEGQSTSSIL